MGDALISSAGHRYPIVDGIPRFLAYEPEETPDVLRVRRAAELAPKVGWREALEQTAEGSIEYVTSPRRVAYVDLLPIGPTTRVLEVGCSLGQGTVALARRAKSVDALEVVPEQAAFAAERLRQEKLDNVTVACGGDDCRLPYSDGRFDLVVVNLVIEWCGQREPGSFLDAQRRLIAEVARTLRPGGVVFIATKNRYGLPYLLGSGDEHAFDLPFGHALPRKMLGLVQRLTGRPERTRGRLVSFHRLSSLLDEAGFGALRAYWAAPDARYPTAYVPFDGDVARARAALPRSALGTRRRVQWIMPFVPAPLLKHLAPSIVLTAVRGLPVAKQIVARAA